MQENIAAITGRGREWNFLVAFAEEHYNFLIGKIVIDILAPCLTSIAKKKPEKKINWRPCQIEALSLYVVDDVQAASEQRCPIPFALL